MQRPLLHCCLAAIAAIALLPVASAGARSSVRVGIGDQNPAMFASPLFAKLHVKRTRYFVAEDVMQDDAARAKARAFVKAARAAHVSVLLHISTADLRSKKGKIVSAHKYKSDVHRIVAYFRKLGVRDFGSWDEVNHKTQETWNHVSNAATYFKEMYRAVHAHCHSCNVVGLDVLDQGGVERYIRSFYRRLSHTWRTRLKVIGIHNYGDVNRSRSSGTRGIIDAVRHYNRHARFWFTETGALASFNASFPYSERRQASRIKHMFSLASHFKRYGVQRVYSYNWFGIETATADCGEHCLFDSGLVNPDGSARPVYDVFASKLKHYSR